MATISGLTVAQMAEKCIGHIDAIGETNYDEASFDNLKRHLEVIDILLGDVQSLTANAVSYEGSVQRIGCRAIGYLAELRDNIDEWLKEAQDRQIQKRSDENGSV